MGWLPMYLLREDIEFLNDWLNQEKEIAFIVANGPSKWIAQREHKILDGKGVQSFSRGIYSEYKLWHIPSGKLPIIGNNTGGVKLRVKKEDWDDDKIPDPWMGWTELRAGQNYTVPYFGPGHPGVFDLEIKLYDSEEIPISGLGWIGNHYKIIGSAADESTEKFWNKLRRMAKKVGTHIPRANNPEWKKEIYAFPAAYNEIKNGRPCSRNP